MRMIKPNKGCLLKLMLTIAGCLLFAPPPLAAAAPEGPAPVVRGASGWLFLGSELHFLSCRSFWGETAALNSRSSKPETADPLPAILGFKKQLSERGIELLLVPVPPKAWNNQYAPPGEWEGLKNDSLTEFYEMLSQSGVRVLDLRPVFKKREGAGEPMFCRTDSHWSGAGCVAAAEAIKGALKGVLPAQKPLPLKTLWKEVAFRGDLHELLVTEPKEEERLKVREITTPAGGAVVPEQGSPLLLMGDSHTLVFREFLAERAGLADQLAHETGIIPDLIGTRGSGANAVRVSLLRRSMKDPQYLRAKKVVVWCFAAREFTESDQGWQPIPLSSASSQK